VRCTPVHVRAEKMVIRATAVVVIQTVCHFKIYRPTRLWHRHDVQFYARHRRGGHGRSPIVHHLHTVRLIVVLRAQSLAVTHASSTLSRDEEYDRRENTNDWYADA